MRNRVVGSIALLAVPVVILSSVAYAQGRQQADLGPPHDLNGVWLLDDENEDGMPGIPWTLRPLPMTPEGLAQFNANIPAKGPRAVHPALGNDLLGDANPPGLMRTFVYRRPWEFVQLPDKLLQVFEWYHFWRVIWTDGREVPEDPDPLWYGHSVGRWEGDTLVVETVGLDPRQWLDDWGTPYSEGLRVEERWRRLDGDNMELTVRIDDPDMYTEPWVSDAKIFAFQPKDSRYGELLEVIFAPIDEAQYNDRIRDTGAGVER